MTDKIALKLFKNKLIWQINRISQNSNLSNGIRELEPQEIISE